MSYFFNDPITRALLKDSSLRVYHAHFLDAKGKTQNQPFVYAGGSSDAIIAAKDFFNWSEFRGVSEFFGDYEERETESIGYNIKIQLLLVGGSGVNLDFYQLADPDGYAQYLANHGEVFGFSKAGSRG